MYCFLFGFHSNLNWSLCTDKTKKIIFKVESSLRCKTCPKLRIWLFNCNPFLTFLYSIVVLTVDIWLLQRTIGWIKIYVMKRFYYRIWLRRYILTWNMLNFSSDTSRGSKAESFYNVKSGSSFIMSKSLSKNLSNENKQWYFCYLQDKTWSKMPILLKHRVCIFSLLRFSDELFDVIFDNLFLTL